MSPGQPQPAKSTIAKLRLARTDGVGPVTWRRLMAQFGAAECAIDALPGLARAGGRATPLVVRSQADAEREIDGLAALGGWMVFAGDADYPFLLGLLPDPPPMLSVLGDPKALRDKAIGVVGARNASANGQRMAGVLATDLAASGLTVVSGMARGIDGAAHEGAMPVGLTVAAVAGGLDHPYPPEHCGLQQRIAERGAVVTEAPLGTAPQSRHFPRRNRVIAGLSLGLVVVEAALRSGSLITARLALESDRELFAVPGSPLDPRCRGSNDLIRQGAHLVESAEDVLSNLPDHPARRGIARSPMFARELDQASSEPEAPYEEVRRADIAASQRVLLGLLSPSPTDVDELIRRSHLPASAVGAALMQLELAGRILFMPGNRVCLQPG